MKLECFEEEQRSLKAEKERQTWLANRNKFTVNLSDLCYGFGSKTLPVMREDWTQIGEIIIQKYFVNTRYPDRISTLHLYAQIAGKTFPLVIISASSGQLYPVNQKIYFIYPFEKRKVCFEEGEWKINMIVDDATITPAPVPLPNGVTGNFQVFGALSLRIEAAELKVEEREDVKRRDAEGLKQKRRKEIMQWVLIVGAILAGLVILLASAFCTLSLIASSVLFQR